MMLRTIAWLVGQLSSNILGTNSAWWQIVTKDFGLHNMFDYCILFKINTIIKKEACNGK